MRDVRSVLVAAVLLCGVSVSWGQGIRSRLDTEPAPFPTSSPTTTTSDGPTLRRAQDQRDGLDGIPHASFTLGGTYTFASDFEDSRGDVSVYRSVGELSLESPVNDKLALSLTFFNEWSWYQFGQGESPVAGGSTKPFGQVTTIRLSPGFHYKLDETWALVGAGSIEVSGDTDAEVDQSLIYGGFIGVRRKSSDTLTEVFGISGVTSLEDDPIFFPVIGMEWDFARHWRLSAPGPGIKIIYTPIDEFSISAFAIYVSREFRLAKSSPIPEGVVRDQRITAGLELEWTPRPWMQIRGEAGVTAWSELEFDTRSGNGLDTLTVDPAAYLGASMTIRF